MPRSRLSLWERIQLSSVVGLPGLSFRRGCHWRCNIVRILLLAQMETLGFLLTGARDLQRHMHSWRGRWLKASRGRRMTRAYLNHQISIFDSSSSVDCGRGKKMEQLTSLVRQIARYAPIVPLRISMYSCTSRETTRWSCISLTCLISPSKNCRSMSFHRYCKSAVMLAFQFGKVDIPFWSSHICLLILGIPEVDSCCVHISLCFTEESDGRQCVIPASSGPK